MYMFLPFLIAFFAAIAITMNKRKLGIFLWFLLFIVTIIWFDYHATEPLNLTF